eukprot:scaffold5532_cov195-Cylindrotheca_fusiformis.AAC.3
MSVLRGSKSASRHATESLRQESNDNASLIYAQFITSRQEFTMQQEHFPSHNLILNYNGS